MKRRPGVGRDDVAPEWVTFLFTDIEGSTERWERFPGPMRSALQRHDEILRTEVDGLRVRMALHSGETDERGGDYFGPPSIA